MCLLRRSRVPASSVQQRKQVPDEAPKIAAGPRQKMANKVVPKKRKKKEKGVDDEVEGERGDGLEGIKDTVSVYKVGEGFKDPGGG